MSASQYWPTVGLHHSTSARRQLTENLDIGPMMARYGADKCVFIFNVGPVSAQCWPSFAENHSFIAQYLANIGPIYIPGSPTLAQYWANNSVFTGLIPSREACQIKHFIIFLSIQTRLFQRFFYKPS